MVRSPHPCTCAPLRTYKVIVDDHFPVLPDSSNAVASPSKGCAVAHSKGLQECWVGLVEKACAKYYGNYAEIEVGTLLEVKSCHSLSFVVPFALFSLFSTTTLIPTAIIIGRFRAPCFARLHGLRSRNGVHCPGRARERAQRTVAVAAEPSAQRLHRGRGLVADRTRRSFSAGLGPGLRCVLLRAGRAGDGMRIQAAAVAESPGGSRRMARGLGR